MVSRSGESNLRPSAYQRSSALPPGQAGSPHGPCSVILHTPRSAQAVVVDDTHSQQAVRVTRLIGDGVLIVPVDWRQVRAVRSPCCRGTLRHLGLAGRSVVTLSALPPASTRLALSHLSAASIRPPPLALHSTGAVFSWLHHWISRLLARSLAVFSWQNHWPLPLAQSSLGRITGRFHWRSFLLAASLAHAPLGCITGSVFSWLDHWLRHLLAGSLAQSSLG